LYWPPFSALAVSEQTMYWLRDVIGALCSCPWTLTPQSPGVEVAGVPLSTWLSNDSPRILPVTLPVPSHVNGPNERGLTSALPARSFRPWKTWMLKTYFLSPNEKTGTKKYVVAAGFHVNEPGMVTFSRLLIWLMLGSGRSL
jgi:hypothetical protein